jgi:hypothetical protein
MIQNKKLTQLEIKSRFIHVPFDPDDPKFNLANFEMSLSDLSNLKILKLATPSPLINSYGYTYAPREVCVLY